MAIFEEPPMRSRTRRLRRGKEEPEARLSGNDRLMLMLFGEIARDRTGLVRPYAMLLAGALAAKYPEVRAKWARALAADNIAVPNLDDEKEPSRLRRRFDNNEEPSRRRRRIMPNNEE
jgi:hypothetical protein